jgi:hypothetical protein
VREAAATTIHSLLLLHPPSHEPNGAGVQVEVDASAILLPIFQALCLHEEAGAEAPSGGEGGGGAAAAAAAAAAAVVAAALFLPTFLRLATSVLDRVLSTEPPAAGPLPLSFWSAPTPPAEELLGTLWALGCSSEPSVRGPALGLLARVLRYWATVGDAPATSGGDDKGGAGPPAAAGAPRAARRGKEKKGQGDERVASVERSRVQERAEALAWQVLTALKAGHTCTPASPAPAPAPELLQELQAVWKALVAALGPVRALALAPRMADDWLGLPGDNAAPPSSATTIFSAHGAEEDWGARRRTAAALAQLAPEVMVARARALLLAQRGVDMDGCVAREWAALLLGQGLGRTQGHDGGGGGGGDGGGNGGQGAVAALQAAMEEGLASLADSESARRLAVAAAAALVEAGAVHESPGPLIRALMEAVKAERDKERQGMAVEALVALVAALLGAGKGRKAVEKVVGNLCVLACAMQQDEVALAAARAGAREALRGLVGRLGPRALEALPVLWPRIAGGLQGGSGSSAEDAVRLLMVITPAVAEDGPALASIRSVAEPLVGLASTAAATAAAGEAAEEEGEGGKGAAVATTTKLASLLAARCLAILFKRGEVGRLAARVGPLLHRALQDRGGETARQRCVSRPLWG